ncbi:hypothetical protein V2J52_15325 [Georgenia sp. MJ173]|uniref:hypothetical protein n=1 Tax=Georgenia sunbinii TaxID=3117728 RepID=UPI002F26C0AC
MSGQGDNLVVRDGDTLVPAPAADQRVLESYGPSADRGPVIDGYRLTLLTRSTSYGVGEPVRIIHVCESVSADAPLYVMGPKAVTGEHVDDELVTEPADDVDPLAPADYDGRAVPGPGVDANYEITQYTFDEAGQHSVQWRPGGHRSNTLQITVS